MRIGAGITVSGEMLGGGEHAFLPRAVDVSAYQAGDLRGVFAKGACVDDGIRGIRIHVGNRKEVPLHSHSPRLLGHNFAELFGKFGLASRAKCHGMRKNGDPIQAHGNAPLKVGSHNQRRLGVALKLVDQHGGFIRSALVKERPFGGHGEQD